MENQLILFRNKKVHSTRTPNLEGIRGMSYIDDKSNMIFDQCLRRMSNGICVKIEIKYTVADDTIQFVIGQVYILLNTLLFNLNYFYKCKETVKINVSKFGHMSLRKYDDLPLYFGSMRTKGKLMTYYLCHGKLYFPNLAKQQSEVKRKNYSFNALKYFSKQDSTLKGMLIQQVDIIRKNNNGCNTLMINHVAQETSEDVIDYTQTLSEVPHTIPPTTEDIETERDINTALSLDFASFLRLQRKGFQTIEVYDRKYGTK